MNRMVRVILAVSITSSLCVSCFLFTKPAEEYKDSYAGYYYEFNGIEAAMEARGGVLLCGAGEPILSYKGRYTERFDSICDYYNDHKYGRKSRVINGGTYNNWINAMHITSVVVTCMEDYNESHPAGSSLNDIIHIISTSPYRYIKGGYKPDVDWEKQINSCSDMFKTVWYDVFVRYNDDLTRRGLYPVDGMLNEIDPDDLAMMSPGATIKSNLIFIAYLVLTEKMSSESCPVRITVTLASGKTMSYEFDMPRSL